MWRRAETEIRPGGLEDDGDPVPSRHQSDGFQVGNARSATKSQADVRWVPPWQGREVMYRILDQLGEPHLSNGPALSSSIMAAFFNS